ncbi:MAG: succinate dehydrogenase, cytochrome b556 subunit [Gammaproteobacteria bacterium]|nr:succinate dehydrogenase, cytochrome b556 subunit [Gammaproteobacteria bacterium]
MARPALSMNSDRPVNLPLPSLFLNMPVTAVTSILHRLSGVALFLGVIYVFYLAELALESAAGFDEAARIVATPFGKLGLWIVLAALAFHFLAGIRHLLLDFHVGDSLRGGQVGGWITFVLTLAAVIVAGAWLW